MRLLSWNVLADAYAFADRYPLTPPALLAPGARHAIIADMAAADGPGICAFQEADEALTAVMRARWGETWTIDWCPKGRNRPDGCLLAVRSPWQIEARRRIVFADGSPASGHVAQLAVLTYPGVSGRTTVVNTHLRWAPPGTPVGDHLGVRQVDLLMAEVPPGPLVLVGDVNDPPGGPVRRRLAACGLHEVQRPGPTALIQANQPTALDVVCVRDLEAAPSDIGLSVQSPLPGPTCPSDHVPIMVELEIR